MVTFRVATLRQNFDYDFYKKQIKYGSIGFNFLDSTHQL